jgi:hypothetical protein
MVLGSGSGLLGQGSTLEATGSGVGSGEPPGTG